MALIAHIALIDHDLMQLEDALVQLNQLEAEFIIKLIEDWNDLAPLVQFYSLAVLQSIQTYNENVTSAIQQFRLMRDAAVAAFAAVNQL